MNYKKAIQDNVTQLIFTCLSFVLMVLIAGLFVNTIIRHESERKVNLALNETEKTVHAYLREPRIVLNNIITNVVSLIEAGATEQELNQYFQETTKTLRASTEVNGFLSIYGLIQEHYINGLGIKKPEGYIPQQQPWYQLAVRSEGAEFSAPYLDVASGALVMSLAQQIFGSDGQYYGVISMDIDTSWLKDYAKSLQFTEGGYGMIINEYLYIIAYPQVEYKNLPLAELGPDYGYISQLLYMQQEVSGEIIRDTNGVRVIVFIRQLFNGWFVGVAMPVVSYYNQLYLSIAVLAALGIIFAMVLCYILIRLSIRGTLAEEESKQKSNFLANMSHEIRTPMNSIIGFAELALMDEMPKQTRDYITKISSSTKLLLSIVNDILDISKIESGKLKLEEIPFFLTSVVDQCFVVIKDKALDKNISLYKEVSSVYGIQVIGDSIRLYQVLSNLLSNAVKFTPSGSITTKLEVRDRKEDYIRVGFQVSDTGIGLNEQQIQMIFEPFTQADLSTTREYGGTGLGLTICKALIEQMGGTLSVESELGKGSSFMFELTMKVNDIKEQQHTEITTNAGRKPIFQGRILVCEDNPMNQEVIREHLERIGIQVDIADNGQIGIDLYHQAKQEGVDYDLIFMDILMPVLDGFETAKRMKEMKVNVPIVALTANLISSEMDKYQMVGIEDCLGKPFTADNLWTCLLKFIEPIGYEEQEQEQRDNEELQLHKTLELNFVKSNQDTYERFVQALKASKQQEARIIVHSLKSNAGQIKQMNLQMIASKIEDMVRDGQKISQEHMLSLKIALDEVLHQLLPLLDEQVKRAPYQDISQEHCQNLMERLKTMIDNSNPECLDLVEEISRIPGTEALVEAIEDFDFKQAELLLKLCCEKHGMRK